MTVVSVGSTWDEWRDCARALLAAGAPPESLQWEDALAAQKSLFAASVPSAPVLAPSARAPAVPRRFVALAEKVVLHRDRARLDLLYRALWRVTHGERDLLDVSLDPLVARLLAMAAEVDRDVHHMEAFVRFRRVDAGGDAWHVARYRPDHRILSRVAPFFAERFSDMRWAILSPDGAVVYDGVVTFLSPSEAPRFPAESDPLEDLWRTYYESAFNPARANRSLFDAHVPSRFRNALPELRDLSRLLRNAPTRTERMIAGERESACDPFLPPRGERSLPLLREAAARCTACDLCGPATQTVFGEGPGVAPLVLVGEQPGDSEDLAGRPFVGPAGGILDDALAEAGIDRRSVYLTNAVKHFKFEPRGTQRLHKQPSSREIAACSGWLFAELETIRPRGIVALGASAARAFHGSRFRLTENRGRAMETKWAPSWLATWHPSAILRAADPAMAERLYRDLVEDLCTIGRACIS